MDNHLQHWGIKGMKWGVRRYQRKDGTLTTLGKMRYDYELNKVRKEEQNLKNQKATKAKIDRLNARVNKLKAEQEALDPKASAKKQKEESETAKKAAKAEAKTKAKATKEEANITEKSIKEMSNEELSRAIDRLKLESDYRRYTTPEKVTSGKSWFETGMKSAGTKILVEGLGAGAAAIVKSTLEKTVQC